MLLLYNVLRHSDWYFVSNVNCDDSAVYNRTAILREAINLAIPYVRSKNPTFPHWFSNSLKCYIKKKNKYFRRYNKLESDQHCSVFTYYRKSVKTTIKTDGLHWLKSMDDSRKTQPKDFWKYVSKFKNNDHVVTQLKIGENVITEQ
jgi:hypothetical protein